ncbi:MAG: 50S ribosomal protein L32 [Candidatus Paraimprobicoccus trichonymphae]|uniref:Large ribosomal subunit protein bL32 n=1 Tax=Candidatus Paraimprobicoccus trichonymphae TaxID=3033793 RepID=A0AA48I635_9FIRM|nr:MAG: 50S ribosomal protein L32 [Candidatus Paraimprobicoccus trichonymphae]
MSYSPKRKNSKSRKNKRRSNVWKLTSPNLVTCKKCGFFRVSHKVCKNCGYYNDVEVVKKELKEA